MKYLDGLIWGTIFAFACRDWGYPKRSQSGWVVIWPRLNPGISRTQCFVTSPLWSSGQSSWLQIRRSGFYSLRYQIGVHSASEYNLPSLWSGGQSSWLQIQRSRFDFWRYHISWQVVGLERGPLSLMSTTEELLGSKSSGSGLRNWKYDRRDLLSWPCDTLYQQKFAQTSPISGGHSVGTVCSQTKATVCFCFYHGWNSWTVPQLAHNHSFQLLPNH
jgi:hypothetical protein